MKIGSAQNFERGSNAFIHPTSTKEPNNRVNYKAAMAVIGALFFIFGFVTWTNGVLIPFLRIACQVSESEAYFVTFAFYIAYTVMALPSSLILKRTGMVTGMRLGLFGMASGCLVFIPAAYTRSFALFLTGLFMIGTGLTLLQTAVNPYITILGPAQSAAKRISIMGLCNKIAGIIAPFILGSILLGKATHIVDRLGVLSGAEKTEVLQVLGQGIIPPYIAISVVLILLGIFLKYAHLPEIPIEHTTKVPITAEHKAQIIKGFFAIFCAVGVEVMAGDTISNYGVYVGFSLDAAKHFTSYTLIGMLFGYLLGILLIPKFLKQEVCFFLCALIGLIGTAFILLTSGGTSVFFLASLGVVNALFWPAIWPVALRGLQSVQVNDASAVLIMGIAGGAIVPLLYGYLLKHSNNQLAYVVLIPCYLFLIGYCITSFSRKKD